MTEGEDADVSDLGKGIQETRGVREQVVEGIGTRKRNLSIGFVSKGTPAWFMFVGNLGRVEWIVGDKDVVARMDQDPPWIGQTDHETIERRCREDPVDLVVFEGCRVYKGHPVWRVPEVGAVMWLAAGGRKLKAPPGWTFRREHVHHEQLGGVTNGVFEVWIGLRMDIGSLEWDAKTEAISNWLAQVIDPTLQGKRIQVEDRPMLNSAKGRLDWKNRWGLVKVPTVFSRIEWVQRALSLKEMANALDLPGPRIRRMQPDELRQLTRIEMPGKVVVHLLKGFKQKEAAKPSKRIMGDEPIIEVARKKRKRTQGTGGTVAMEETEPNYVAIEAGAAEGLSDKAALADKAVKADDAEVPIFLWDRRVLSRYEDVQWAKGAHALAVLRGALLRCWKRKVEASFLAWLEQEKVFHDEGWLEETQKIGQSACSRAWGASWWEWDKGSALFFWRWPADYLEQARIGTRPWFVSAPPASRERQPEYDDEETRAKVLEKVGKVVDRRYIERVDKSAVASLMHMFHVPKGDSDIRMVYDGTRSGLNDALWAPWFALPRVSTMCGTVGAGTWCGDNDYGEMFLNFPMHPELRQYAGVDLTQLLGGEFKEDVYGTWNRNAMGLKSSPYLSVQGGLQAKRLMLGDPHDVSGESDEEGNPFQWDSVVQNLPGSHAYDPTLPWIYKVRKDGRMATDLHVYIDDVRITGADEETAWRASSRVAKCCSWLGLQDAARKRRQPSQTPGAWAGSVISSTPALTKSVTQERWEKTQTRIRWIAKELSLETETGMEVPDTDFKGPRKEGTIPHKQLERYRGFLVYVAQTFEALVPYLKGIHLTLDSWRSNRDEDGWRLANASDRRLVDPAIRNPKAPVLTKVVPRLREDVKALMTLTRALTPPLIPVRASKTAGAYLWGDASGAGFGNCLWVEGSNTIELAYGTWESQITENSSNFREAYNLILALERLVGEGRIERGTEVWIFTDNSVAEKTFSKGSSRSKLIHDLCLRLRTLEMSGSIITHFVWVAGTRMIDQGTDGLSRGDIVSGIMGGEEFLSFVPVSLTVEQRSPEVSKWLMEALPGTWHWLEPKDWFDEAFKDPLGRYVWMPPPCLAEYAMEKLCEIMQLHPNTSHCFVCPMLMTMRWRKQLLKASDASFHIPVGCSLWHSDQHEPLHVSLTCPLMSCSPYQARERPELLAELGCKMSRVWRHDCEDEWRSVRKFWLRAWSEAGQV